MFVAELTTEESSMSMLSYHLLGSKESNDDELPTTAVFYVGFPLRSFPTSSHLFVSACLTWAVNCSCMVPNPMRRKVMNHCLNGNTFCLSYECILPLSDEAAGVKSCTYKAEENHYTLPT